MEALEITKSVPIEFRNAFIAFIIVTYYYLK